MTRRLLFVGAGAVGSYIGAFLARAGHDVTLVDPWAEQVDAIHTRGISVSGPHEPFVARANAVHLRDADRLPPDFDMAFVAVKAYDTEWATRLALPHLKPEGFVVSAQNCWNDPTIAAIAGAERAVGLVMSRISVALWTPGAVERGAEKGSASGHHVFRAGEHSREITPRVTELAQMLSAIDGARATDNLWGERWSKLCLNSMGNPVQAMTGLGSMEIASDPRGREITIRLAQESAQVGIKLGYGIPSFRGAPAEKWADAERGNVYRELEAMLATQGGARKNWRASMAQDVIKGRRSEIDYMNGHVVAQGREVGVETPVSSAVVGLVREIDAGARTPSPETIELALRGQAFASILPPKARPRGAGGN